MKTISFVIPFYNEEKRIKKTLHALLHEVQLADLKLEKVIFVDDGSTDATATKIRQIQPDLHQVLGAKIQILGYDKNRGKGYAIRQGMGASTSEYTLFFDADMSTPLSELTKFLPLMQTTTQVIIGTRKNGKSTVIKHQPLYREVLGKGFTYFSNSVLQTSFTDFTCGFKAFHSSAKNILFAKTKINRWGFDAEILFLTKTEKLSWKEVPVVWKNEGDSKVKLIYDLPRSFFELLSIRLFHLQPLGLPKLARTTVVPFMLFASWVKFLEPYVRKVQN